MTDESNNETREERFIQPVDAIEIVSLQPGPRVTLTLEEMNTAQQRVMMGEDPELVAEELAIQKVAEEESQK